ncbi:hypothetical protein NDN08_007960 [Rhodosorus marinus]|uniref:Mitochondrial carrier protein n=1 Tax=Rhodosorus marinus TaxID=101924 RepID=A0AAV8V468_9RHOD|nr:hypothetical protein NDN08_007960 [Rhodosorus marinus]
MDSTENGIATGMLTSNLFETAFAASVGASCTALVATPLDVVKTRMQSHVCDAGVCVNQAHFGGPLDGMRKIWRMDGTRALWRGFNVTLTIVVPSTAVYFTVYDGFSKFLRSGMSLEHTQATLIAGASARMMTTTVFGPLELARTRIQSGMEGNRTVLQVLANLVRDRGIRSLWAGLLPTLWRDAPFSAIYWTSYEQLKREDGLLCRLTSSPIVVSLLAGTGAGSVAALVTTPADVIKTRRQAIQLSAAESKFADRTFLASLRLVAREEGLFSLMTGAGPRLAKVAPSCAIMMGCYELVKQVFQELRHLRMSSS